MLVQAVENMILCGPHDDGNLCISVFSMRQMRRAVPWWGYLNCEPYNGQVEASTYNAQTPCSKYPGLRPMFRTSLWTCGFIKSLSAVVMFWSFGCLLFYSKLKY